MCVLHMCIHVTYLHIHTHIPHTHIKHTNIHNILMHKATKHIHFIYCRYMQRKIGIAHVGTYIYEYTAHRNTHIDIGTPHI